MRLSRFHLHTTKETPAEAELASHRLMLRAGMIRKLAAGIYTWTPLGLRVLRKVEGIVREEMDRAGALEMLMPSIQPRELWDETGRWQKFGGQLLKIKDRKDAEFCYGPTHEEVVTDWARSELSSYRQLPVNVYQIQTKFRDEIRPRFGVMRAREFLMKDAYSFHLTPECLARGYQVMFDAYTRIFERLGLRFRAVQADSGAIGGNASQEFHVLQMRQLRAQLALPAPTQIHDLRKTPGREQDLSPLHPEEGGDTREVVVGRHRLARQVLVELLPVHRQPAADVRYRRIVAAEQPEIFGKRCLRHRTASLVTRLEANMASDCVKDCRDAKLCVAAGSPLM